MHLDFTQLAPPLRALPLPQQRLERLLDDRAGELDAEIRRGHEVTGISQDGTAVTVDVLGPDGPYQVVARYLVGCDGGRSRVRDRAAVPFPGIAYPEVNRLAQVTLPAAEEVARYIVLDPPGAWANFSPTNVSPHTLSTAVAFGDADVDLETARPLMHRRIPVPVWVEAVPAYSQQGRLADGYQALRIAESCAAEDIRRPAVRELVADPGACDRRRTLLGVNCTASAATWEHPRE